MNPLLRNSEAHVFVKSLDAPSLSFEDEHHLDRVLRLEATDPITISDGQGKWATATWSRERGVTFTSKIHEVAKRSALTVGLAIPKGDRPELVVQKLTELGVDRILLFETTHSVVHWDADRRTKQFERLSRIAREAAMQSRRVFTPHIQFTEFEHVIHQHGIAIAEPGGRDDFDDSITGILIGPEGGFDREELDYAVPKIGLGSTVLRVETAAIVAAYALVKYHGG